MKIKNRLKGRIDQVLTTELKNKNISRTYLQKLINNKQILVNDKAVSNNYILKEEDNISVNIPEPELLDIAPENIDFEIVYQDEDILILNKPNDLIVHPSNTQKNNTLVNALLHKIKNLSDINGIIRPGIVHRIDRKTTGLLVVAKNNISHQSLSKQLKDKKVKRYYMTIVHGIFINKSGTINAPIGRDPNNRKKMAVTNKNCKTATTHFKVLKNYTNFSLLKCELDTGRTHQIRVHMNYIKHPIYGDNTYGMLSDKNNEFGQYLHAYKLELIHPKTKEPMIFEANLPIEFLNKIKELELERE